MQVYAEEANDRQLLEDATEIRLRAERNAGEMLAEMEKNRGSAGPGRGKAGKAAGPAFNDAPKLADLGVSKAQSSNWQRLAAMPARPHFATLPDYVRTGQRAAWRICERRFRPARTAKRRIATVAALVAQPRHQPCEPRAR